jgi:hypothetical protein
MNTNPKNRVPTGPLDVPLDGVITETGAFRFAQPGGSA